MSRFAFFTFAALLIGASASRAEVEPNRVREQIQKLSFGETDVDAGMVALQSFPRAQVIEILRDDLNASLEPSAGILRAMTVLHASELMPLLLKIANRSERYEVFSTLQSLSLEPTAARFASGLKALYIKKLEGASSAALQLAAIDGLTSLRVPLSSAVFSKLTQSTSLSVREAAWTAFLNHPESYSTSEKSLGIKKALATKPYRVRLQAYQTIARLPASERIGLALPEGACVRERKSAVRAACLEARGSAK